MKKIYSYCLMGLMVFSVIATGCGNSVTNKEAEKKAEIFISAAASLTDAMQEIGALYEKANPKEKITYNFGSSGALQSQIQQGAPADIFISAAQKQMNVLEEKNLIKKETRQDLLVNKVVLITAKDSKTDIQSFQEITKAKHIALGEPKGVPVGQYAEQIFTKLNILDGIKPKAVYASDVRQVLTWVENNEAEVGVVYATDAAISPKVKIICEAPVGSHKPVIYPAAITTNGKNVEAAKKFMAFLTTQEATDVFKKYGFQVK